MEPITVKIKRNMMEDCQDQKALVFHLFEEAGVSYEKLKSGVVSAKKIIESDHIEYTWIPGEVA